MFLTFVKQDQTKTKSFILRKVFQITSMEMVVIFGVFDAIGAMLLLISPERIELEGCACAQIKALEEGNWWLHPDNAWERDRNATNFVLNFYILTFSCPFRATSLQRNPHPGWKYWATRLAACSFASLLVPLLRLFCSLGRLLCTACVAPALHCTHLFACSLTRG